jgi:hypothetical protein
MYTALLGCLTTPGLDGMRFALFLFNLSVFQHPYRKQVSRTTVRPWCHLFLRQQTWQEKFELRRRRRSADVEIALAISTSWCSSRRQLQAG